MSHKGMYGVECRCLWLENELATPRVLVDLELVKDPSAASGFGTEGTCRMCGVKGTKIVPFVPNVPPGAETAP